MNKRSFVLVLGSVFSLSIACGGSAPAPKSDPVTQATATATAAPTEPPGVPIVALATGTLEAQTLPPINGQIVEVGVVGEFEVSRIVLSGEATDRRFNARFYLSSRARLTDFPESAAA